MKKLMQIGN